MNISEGLLLQKDIAEEASRLKRLAESEANFYQRSDGAGQQKPNFDLEANHQRVRQLTKLHRKISRAIAKANATVQLDLIDAEYQDWL